MEEGKSFYAGEVVRTESWTSELGHMDATSVPGYHLLFGVRNPTTFMS